MLLTLRAVPNNVRLRRDTLDAEAVILLILRR
jgi:hypothetical protein